MSAGGGGGYNSPMLAPPPACRLGVVWTVGDKENAGAGGVRAAVLDLDRWGRGALHQAPEV